MKKLLFNNILINLILGIIKYLGALLTNSVALFSDAMYSLSSSLKNISINYQKDKSKKTDNIYNTLVGAIATLLGFIIILNIFTTTLVIPKFWSIVIIILCYLTMNLVNAYKYALNFNNSNKEMLLIERNYISMLIIPVLVLISIIITLFNKYLSILKYADVFVGCLIAIYLILKGIRFIVINFKEKEEVDEKVIKELLSKEKIIVSTNKCLLTSYGNSYKLTLDISLQKEITLVDAYSRILEIASKIFKKFKNIELISIYKSPIRVKKEVKKNARNSRSRNSKKSPKKTSSKQKNKKR